MTPDSTPNENQPVSPIGRPITPKEKPAPLPKETPSDPSVFGGESQIMGEGLRNWGKSNPAWERTNIYEEERMKILQDVFGSGDYLTKSKAENKLRELESKRSSAVSDAERESIGKKIKVVRAMLGK